jgi:hypothetical protein
MFVVGQPELIMMYIVMYVHNSIDVNALFIVFILDMFLEISSAGSKR